eukprot:GEMP01016619.1.p1 GENE.GEMP01016619.1~~GEMP01016619.1.p1  ORF type:complete len:500 (+),score=106.02 GEMP01016619.1:296-1795(+)
MGNTESSTGEMRNACYEMASAPRDEIFDETSPKKNHRNYADQFISPASSNNRRGVPSQMSFASSAPRAVDRRGRSRLPADGSGCSLVTVSKARPLASANIRAIEVIPAISRGATRYLASSDPEEHNPLQVDGCNSMSTAVRATAARRSPTDVTTSLIAPGGIRPSSAVKSHKADDTPVTPSTRIAGEPTSRSPPSTIRSVSQIPHTMAVTHDAITRPTGRASKPSIARDTEVPIVVSAAPLYARTYSSTWVCSTQRVSGGERPSTDGHMQHVCSTMKRAHTPLVLSRYHVNAATTPIPSMSHDKNNATAQPPRSPSVCGVELYEDIPEAHRQWMPTFRKKSRGTHQLKNRARHLRSARRERSAPRLPSLAKSGAQKSSLGSLRGSSNVPGEGVGDHTLQISKSLPKQISKRPPNHVSKSLHKQARTGHQVARAGSTPARRMVAQNGGEQKQPQHRYRSNSYDEYEEGYACDGSSGEEESDGVAFVYYGAIVGTMLSCLP